MAVSKHGKKMCCYHMHLATRRVRGEDSTYSIAAYNVFLLVGHVGRPSSAGEGGTTVTLHPTRPLQGVSRRQSTQSFHLFGSLGEQQQCLGKNSFPAPEYGYVVPA
jgi:hypothetical protein